ncbi:MAG: AraC family transcriptional regulator [Planctomycetota bacterium]|nr:MAG: AraC family transcriptional regulator [Planctomycetota bacterium]
MRYLEFPPPADLADRVRLLWLLEDEHASGAQEPERVLPDGCLEVVLHWGAPYDADTRGDGFHAQAHAVLAGQIERSLRLRATGAVGMLGARLHPWAGGCLRGTSPTELHQRLAPLDELWGAATRHVTERLVDARDDDTRLRVMHELLRARLSPLDAAGRELAAAVRSLERSAGATRIADLAGALGHSTRKLQRRFASRVGLSPKHFARITRLQALASQLDAEKHAPLAQLAARLGYADQPHLAREVRDIVGVPLRAWRAEAHALTDCFLGTHA